MNNEYTPIEFIAQTSEEELKKYNVDTIKAIMSAELVRCEDCGLYDVEKKHCDWHDIEMDKDDYCSHGVRKNPEIETINFWMS